MSRNDRLSIDYKLITQSTRKYCFPRGQSYSVEKIDYYETRLPVTGAYSSSVRSHAGAIATINEWIEERNMESNEQNEAAEISKQSHTFDDLENIRKPTQESVAAQERRAEAKKLANEAKKNGGVVAALAKSGKNPRAGVEHAKPSTQVRKADAVAPDASDSQQRNGIQQRAPVQQQANI